MSDNEDPLAQFGLDAIDLRWTMKDIAGKRPWLINKEHLAKLIDLGLVEMREDTPYLTIAGQNTVWTEGMTASVKEGSSLAASPSGSRSM